MTPSMLKRYRENMNASYQPEGELIEKKMTKKDIKKRDEIADAISTKDMKDRYGDKNVKYAIATKIVMDKKKKKKKKKKDVEEAFLPMLIKAKKSKKIMLAKKILDRKKKKEEEEEENMNEQLGGTGPKVAPSSNVMKQKLLDRQKQQSDIENIANSRVSITKTSGTGAGGLKNISVSDAGTSGRFMQNKINQSGSGMTANSLGVGNVGKFVSNKAGEALDSNSTIPTGIKNELKKGLQDKALKINQNVPGTDAFKLKNISMGINQKNLKASYDMEKSVVESDLIVQDWNVDDIKYTEIETVDVIKPRPIKESHSNWREDMDLNENILKKGFDIVKKTPIVKKLQKKTTQLGMKLGDKLGASNFIPSVKRLLKGRPKGSKNRPIQGKQLSLDIGDTKVKFPVDKTTSQNIQTQSVKNTAKKIADQGKINKKFNKGSDPVKVNLKKDINFDKYFSGTTKTKSGSTDFNKNLNLKKNTDNPIKVNMQTKLDDYLFGPDKDAPVRMFDRKIPIKGRRMFNPNEKPKQLRNIKKKFNQLDLDLNDHYDWRAQLDEDWQKVNRKDKTDGLSQKAVNAYRRENPGSKLKTAVTTKPSKLKKGSKSAKRRLSFCRRMKGMKKKLTSAKTRRDPDSRINKALRRWNC